MKAKWICGWIAMLLLFCQPVAAKNESVLDETLYYGEALFYQTEDGGFLPITTIKAGEILCQYSVISKETADVAMIAGLYHQGALQYVKASSRTVTAEGGTLYAANVEVPAEKDYEIRLFLVRDLAVTAPMKRVAALSEKSCAKDVTDFSLCGADGRIDSLGNRIAVTVPAGSELSAAVPEVVVSPGATYTMDGADFSETVFMTVTAEDQSTRTYAIETAYDNRKDRYDFEDAAVGEGMESHDPEHWVGPLVQNPDIIETVTQTESGNVLQLTDQSLTARADVRSTNWEMTAPFTLSVKISYCLPDGVTERSQTDDYSYCTFFATNDNALNLNKTDFYYGAFEPVWGNDAFYFYYYKEGSRVKTNVKVIPSAWYDVTMRYWQDKDGIYYMDYTVVDEDGKKSEFLKIPSGRTETKLTGFYLVTSPGRRATILLDDISVTEDKSYGCTQYTQDFADAAPEGWSGGTIKTKDGRRVLHISSDAVTAKIPEFLGGTSMAFDWSIDDLSGSGTLLAFGTEAETIGTLSYQNGVLGYAKDGETVPFEQLGKIRASEVYRIRLEYVKDAAYENNRVDYYVNDVRIGSAKAAAVPESIDCLRFTAPDSGMDIANVNVVKR